MKRNSTVIRKLKSVTEDNCVSILDDISKTNQAKYIDEAALAISEAALKLKDIPAAVKVASALHQRYAGFAPVLVNGIMNQLNQDLPGVDDKAGVNRFRVLLRFEMELLLVGIAPSHVALLNAVKRLGTGTNSKERPKALGSITLVISFIKAGRDELLGLQPSFLETYNDEVYRAKVAEYQAELDHRNEWFQTGVRELFLSVCTQILDSLCQTLKSLYETLTERENRNERLLTRWGDLPESASIAYEDTRAYFDALQRNVMALAEVLDKEPPMLASEEEKKPCFIENDTLLVGSTEAHQIFEDEESREFYEDLLDLRAVVPAVLLGGKSAELSMNKAVSERDEDKESEALTEELAEEELEKEGKEVEEEEEEEGVGEEGETGKLRKGQVHGILARLPGMVTKELCDEIAVEFCYVQSKNAKKKLMNALCDVPLGALSLIPPYARLIATLHSGFPDITEGVVLHLEKQFRMLQRIKDATGRTRERRVRNMWFIAELCKFNMFPHGMAFSFLKGLLDNFSGYNVDSACALVESAGRFFIRKPETKARMSNMIEIMVKLKAARNFDVRQSSLVDAAYHAVQVSGTGIAVKRKSRPPLHEWIRYQIYVQLLSEQPLAISKELRCLPWQQDDERYLIKTIVRSSWKGKASQLVRLAILAHELSKYHPSFAVGLIDSVMEEIAIGLEKIDSGLYQRRLAVVKLLGEFYNQGLLPAPVIFGTLFLFITAGHEEGESKNVRPDPPNSSFRIRLICTLLGTCAPLRRQNSPHRHTLEVFMLHFERYMKCKPALPLDIGYDVEDLFERLNITPRGFETVDQATAAIEALEHALQPGPARSGLDTISESQEEEHEDDVTDSNSSSESATPDSRTDSSFSDEEELDISQLVKNQEEELDLDFEKELAALLPPNEHPSSSTPSNSITMHVPAAMGSATFKVMLKRAGGGRDDKTKELTIPLTAGMAAHMREKESREAAEKAEVKRLVLQANTLALQEELEGDRNAVLAFNTRGGRGQNSQRGRGSGAKRWKREAGMSSS